MRTALLREGAGSAVFRNAEQLIDDLLWTLDEHSGVGNRRQLAQRIPALIKQVNTGMREVSAKEQDHQAFFDELFLIHLRKLQRLPEGGTTTERAARAADSVPDLSSQSQSAIERAGRDVPTMPVLRATVALPEPESVLAPATAPVTVSIIGPVSEVARRVASNDDNVAAATLPLGGNRLLSVLQDIDLEDLPDIPKWVRMPRISILRR